MSHGRRLGWDGEDPSFLAEEFVLEAEERSVTDYEDGGKGNAHIPVLDPLRIDVRSLLSRTRWQWSSVLLLRRLF